MSLLLQCQSLSKRLGIKTLFSNLSLTLHKKDKVAIIGPNGAGKSTLLKLLTKEENATEGSVSHKRGLCYYFITQEFSFSKLTAFEELSSLASEVLGKKDNALIEVETALSKVGFEDYHQEISTLSGGWKKRLQIAKALLINPDFLILDEPTNHLDLDSILWLESFLNREVSSYIAVSHDRLFLERTCEKTLEINPLYPDGYFYTPFPYSNFLEKKAEFLQELENKEQSLKSKSKKELVFLKSTPKARATKSQARTTKAHEILGLLKRLKDKRLKHSKSIELSVDSKEKRSKLLIKLFGAEKSYGDNKLFSFEDFKIVDGMKLGILGPNGCGKSTFIKCLLDNEPLSSGTLKRRENLTISYLSQDRSELNEKLLVKDALSPKGDFAYFQDQHMHVASLGQIFGFDKDQLDQRVSSLSGGEKAKILLARSMEKICDIFVLDEPTNDLDISTLETLESSLINFKGAVVFVTHDRYFLDSVSNHILTFQKGISHFFAQYQQYEDWQEKENKLKRKQELKPVKTRKQNLDNQEKKELRRLPKEIENLEKKLEKSHLLTEEASLKQDFKKANEEVNISKEIETELLIKYKRWQELEDQRDA
jgi:ABC transport system ATP-binding/permease protein